MQNVMDKMETAVSASPVTFRPGTVADSYAVFLIFEYALADLLRRLGFKEPTSAADPEALARMWQERRSLYEHLARTAEHFWLAVRDGQAIGFSRSILRDGLRQLTEIFVLPGIQSAGIGRELLARAFPADGARRRTIISTPDIRAQALYLKSGVYPQFSIYYFWRRPDVTHVATDLIFTPLTGSPAEVTALGVVDSQVLGFQRDVDHVWLSANRQGYLYSRGGQVVGYGYLGKANGPFALLDNRDFPAVLAHAESQAYEAGGDHFGLEVPMLNRAAVDYLLARGFQMEPLIVQFMSDGSFGQPGNYIFTSPPFFC